MAVVSNRPKPIEDIVARLGLSEVMDFTLAAGEVDLWKPDPALLLYAASVAGVDPREAVYVGDSYDADVVCARSAGMLPVLVDPRALFPEADCPVIAAIGELPQVLKVSV